MTKKNNARDKSVFTEFILEAKILNWIGDQCFARRCLCCDLQAVRRWIM